MTAVIWGARAVMDDEQAADEKTTQKRRKDITADGDGIQIYNV